MIARPPSIVAVALLLLAMPPSAPNAAPSKPSAVAAAAGDLGAAEQLFTAGRFAEAAELATRIGGGEGLTLAVRARLALAYTRPPARVEVCKETVALAERASRHRPADAESLRLWVIALGNLARNGSTMAAMSANYPERTRALIDRALALEPDSAWVHAILGAWHAEIVDRLGATMADGLFGASAEAARAAFARAIEIDPTNPILHAELAHGSLQLGDAAGARLELATARRLMARDAMESLIQSHAAEALKALDEGDDARARRMLEPTC